MPRQPAPVAVPVASYIGQRLRLLAICDDCWNVARQNPAALPDQHDQGMKTKLARRVSG